MSAASTPSTDTLVLRRPDDWHVHLRDGAMLEHVVDATASQFARAIVMPNLVPPVTTVAAGAAYRERILAAVSPELDFTPLMTAYLTDEIDPEEVARGHAEGVFTACKLYPANATTNSAAGVTDVANIARVLERMQAIGMPLLIHGEVTSPEVDIFDREAVFIDQILAPLRCDFPELKVVLEHITTRNAVQYVEAGDDCLAAPHERSGKESSCGCAGIYSAPIALESYAQTFEELGALAHLEGFASEHGPRFYGLPLNERTVTLARSGTEVPEVLQFDDCEVVPFHAGETLTWKMV